jgi:hypothetical protein
MKPAEFGAFPGNALIMPKHRMADDERYRTFIAPGGIM